MQAVYQVHQLKIGYMGFINYVYLIVDEASGQAIVVDPAWDLKRITNKAEELGVKLKAILLTHSHYDHTNLVDPLVNMFDLDVYMSQEEIDYYKFKCRNLVAVRDGEVLNFGSTKITCILTPGHTYGGMCYLLSDSLFTGDTVFVEGCGTCGFVGGSPEKMYESFQTIKRVAPPHVRVYPAHSYGKPPGYRLSYLLKENIYFLFEKKQHFVEFRTRKNQPSIWNFQ